MSYHKYQYGNTTRLALGQVAYFPELNCRKKWNNETKTFSNEPAVFDPADPETKVLIASLQDRGYDPQWPCIVGPITDEQKADALKRLEQEWIAHKSNDNLTPGDLSRARLVAFEYFYTHEVGKKDKSRKLLVPEYLGCTGNRRNRCLFEAAVQRLLETKKGDPKKDIVADPDIFNHPERCLEGLEAVAVVESFADMDARQMRQIAENDTKLEGNKKLSPIEVVLNFYDAVVTGRMNQKKIRESQRDGTGQKIYGFIVLAARFLGLDMINRLMKPTDDPRHINWGKLPQGGQEGFPSVIRDSDQYSRDQYVAKMTADGKADKIEGSFMTEEDVENRIQKWMTGKNEPKVMAKPIIQELQKGNPCAITRNICQDILENKRTEIDILSGKAPAFNTVRSLVNAPCFNNLNELLGLVQGCEAAEQTALVRAMIDAGTAYVAGIAKVEEVASVEVE